MMMRDERAFEQRIHDAYEHVELGEEARERMLGALLAAQAQRDREVAPTAESAPEAMPERTGAAQVVPFVRRRTGWRVWLPVAAALAVAFVVVRAAGVGSRQDVAMETSSNAAADKSADDDAAVTEDAAAGEDLPSGMSYDQGAAVEAQGVTAEEMAMADDFDALGMVDYYPGIRLEDGTMLTALEEGLYTRELAPEDVGESVGPAKAFAFDEGENGVSCEVFTVIGDEDAFAVRYEGEESYWRCTRL